MPGRAVGSALFVTWNGGGNVTPVLVLARRLLAGGTEVTVLGEPALSERFDGTGVRFEARDEVGLWDPQAIAHDTGEACRSASADVAIVDYMMPTALCGTEAARVPTAVLVHTLYGALLADGAPAPIFMAANVDSVNDARSTLGLDPVGSMGALLDRSALVMVPCPPELDVVVDPLPRNVRYVAPLLDDGAPGNGWLPPAGDDPLIVVSLGTTPMDEEAVLARVLEALGQSAVRGVVTVGAHLDPAAIDAPANCVVSSFIAHAAVLPYASAVITHAGLGTVLASLNHGVPMLCLPLGREQPDNAAAVERVGAGIALTPEAQPSEIADAVRTVLDTPGYNDRAVAMQALLHVGPDAIDELAAVAPRG